MLRNLFRFLVLLCCVGLTGSAKAATVTIDTESARAVLAALQNPTLNHDEALKIAQLPGNQGIIRKLIEFKVPASSENFAAALYNAAHGEQTVDPTEIQFQFDRVKPKIPLLLELLKQIEANTFRPAIERRIALFTPPNSEVKLKGYVVAGGDGGGYAFGGTDFYLNIGITDELVVAQGITTHELYHAVQGAFASQRSAIAARPNATKTQDQQVCANTAALFANLYEEGSAVYVEDTALLDRAHSEIGLRILNDRKDGLRHIRSSIFLLDMSAVSLRTMPYDEVYDVGFLGHGTLYNIAYVIARAIGQDDGPQALAAFLKQPPYTFVLRYTQLPKYGKDADHPTLGSNTLAALNSLTHGCK